MSTPAAIEPWQRGALTRHRVIGFGSAIVAAAVVTLFAPSWLRETTRAVASYDAAALMMLMFFWFVSIKRDAASTARRAAVDDPGRNVVLALILLSVAIGFASAIVILGRGANVPAAEKTVSVILGLLAVIMGWALMHTLFVFRYAHLFYFDDDDDGCAQRGLIFPGTTDPSDYDFAYFSFVIGMTFQVSDVQITDPGVRRVVLFHGIISFAYNTAILALGVNLVSGLLAAH